MLMNRQQLAMHLCYLAKEDYALLNDIIIDYCDLIDDNKFNNLEDVVNSELQSIVWGLHHYYRVLRGVAKLTQLCYN